MRLCEDRVSFLIQRIRSGIEVKKETLSDNPLGSLLERRIELITRRNTCDLTFSDHVAIEF